MAQDSDLRSREALIVVDGHDTSSGTAKRALRYAAGQHQRVGVLVTADAEAAVRRLLDEEHIDASRLVVTDSLRDTLDAELARCPADVVVAGVDQLGATALGTVDTAPDLVRATASRGASLVLLGTAR